MFIRPARLFNWGLFSGEDPTGVIAWIALRNSRTSHAPHYPELILVEGLLGNCENKNESLVNLQNDSKTGR